MVKGEENKGKLAMAILEGTALKYAALGFCTCCYSLEGDAPLILTAYDVLDGLEKKILNGFDMPAITATAELVAMMLEEVAAPLLEAKHQAEDVLQNTEEQLQNTISSVIPLTSSRRRLTHSINASGRERRRTALATDHDAVAIVDAQLNAANEAVEEGNRVKDLAVKALKKEDKLLQEWKNKFLAASVAELIVYAHDVASPGIAYYRKQYREEGGDLYRLRLSAEACQIFDPFKLCSFSVERLNLLADKLSHFEYRQFTSEFIEGLKKEIPFAIGISQQAFDWDSIKETKQYKTRMSRSIKRRQLGDDHDFDWKKDPGEKACRIWEWWKVRLLGSHGFHHYKMALRLVVLAQLSSCSVERVFSQLKLIRDACGDNMKGDMCEIRMFLRSNGEIFVDSDD